MESVCLFDDSGRAREATSRVNRGDHQMALSSLVPFVVAVLGWMITGFASIAVNRVDYVNPVLLRADVRAFGLLVALGGIISAFVFSHWWWGLAVLLASPNMAAVLVMMLTPRH
jgi:hypothetical protein